MYIVFYIPDFHASSNAGVFQFVSSDMGGNLAGGWVTSLVSGWLELLLGGKDTEGNNGSWYHFHILKDKFLKVVLKT